MALPIIAPQSHNIYLLSFLTMLSKTDFFKLSLSIFSVLFLITALTAAVIDPRGMFHIVDIDGFNSKKASFLRYETFIKPYQAINSEASYVFLGDSRANTIFASSLEHRYFAGKPIYSAGMAGQSIYADYRMLQHIQDMHITQMIVFVDHLSFFSSSPLNQSIVKNNSEFSRRLNYNEDGGKNHTQWLQGFKDTALLLCSFNILQDSLETIQKQHSEGWYLLQNGTWGGGLAYDGKPQRKNFDYIERNFLLEPLADMPYTQPFYESSEINTFSTLEKFITLAHDLKIKVEFIIPPVHARMFEVIFSMGRWQDYENWKRTFVFTNEEIAKKLNDTPFTIWDFTAYNDITTEPVPQFNDKLTHMRWFYDDVHVQPALGEFMLNEMDHYTDDTYLVTKLTALSVEKNLANLYTGHNAYQQQQPKEVRQIYTFCLRVSKDSSRCTPPKN